MDWKSIVALLAIAFLVIGFASLFSAIRRIGTLKPEPFPAGKFKPGDEVRDIYNFCEGTILRQVYLSPAAVSYEVRFYDGLGIPSDEHVTVLYEFEIRPVSPASPGSSPSSSPAGSTGH